MDKFASIEQQEKRFLNNISKFPEQERNLMLKAFEFARNAHQDQTRPEFNPHTPYIIHPLRVANSLITETGVHDKKYQKFEKLMEKGLETRTYIGVRLVG